MERKRKDLLRSGPHVVFSSIEDSERVQRDMDLNGGQTWLVHAFVCTAFVNSNSSITLPGLEMRLARANVQLQTANLPWYPFRYRSPVGDTTP